MSPNRLSPTFLQHSRSTKSATSKHQPQKPTTSSSLTMDNNLETEPQPTAPTETESTPMEPQDIAMEAPSTPQPEPPIASPSPTDSVPDVPPSPASSVTAPSVPSDQSEPSEAPRTEGPLSSLAQKAAETQLGRTASQNIPESARPTLQRASRVLHTVDEHLLAAKETLDTDEGRRVVTSACEFASSLIAFITMLFASAVSFAERKLAMEPVQETMPKRFVNVCREATKKVRTCAETREKQVCGSCEARMYAHARQVADVLCTAFKSCLKGMSEFKGPGNEYVCAAAQKFISILPEDVQVSIRQSQGPLKSLRNGLNLESETSSSSQGTPTAPTHETYEQASRMKVD